MSTPQRRSWFLTTAALLGTLCILVGCLRGIPHPMQAQSPEDYPTAPILRPETGMHTAPVRRIDVDREERFLVSGSHDKTVRVWDLASGRLLRTLRVPLGEGNLGKVYAVAISPDGSTVAVGGYTGKASGDHLIYIFDRATGSPAPPDRRASERHPSPRLCPGRPAPGGGLRRSQWPAGL